jgi:large subunit ribosomal protein L22
MKAYLKQIRISPKKANLVAALVRRLPVQEAVDILRFTPKKTAPVLRKLIESAAANAENNFKQKKENLVIKEIIVSDGPTYKRRNMISRGRTHPILKRTSHISVSLEAATQEEEVKAKEPAKKEVEKIEKTEVKTEVKAEVKVEKKEESKKPAKSNKQ